MNNEELDEARVKEGRRIVQDRHPAHIPQVGEVAREVAQAEREGWVMVPREPTEAMIKAAWADLGDTYQRSTRNLADAYHAMLSAAPKEPDHG
jgi:hypothetical protein